MQTNIITTVAGCCSPFEWPRMSRRPLPRRAGRPLARHGEIGRRPGPHSSIDGRTPPLAVYILHHRPPPSSPQCLSSPPLAAGFALSRGGFLFPSSTCSSLSAGSALHGGYFLALEEFGCVCVCVCVCLCLEFGRRGWESGRIWERSCIGEGGKLRSSVWIRSRCGRKNLRIPVWVLEK